MDNYKNVLAEEKAIYRRLGIEGLTKEANRALDERDLAVKGGNLIQ